VAADRRSDDMALFARRSCCCSSDRPLGRPNREGFVLDMFTDSLGQAFGLPVNDRAMNI
jgi:hypothetical protein